MKIRQNKTILGFVVEMSKQLFGEIMGPVFLVLVLSLLSFKATAASAGTPPPPPPSTRELMKKFKTGCEKKICNSLISIPYYDNLTKRPYTVYISIANEAAVMEGRTRSDGQGFNHALNVSASTPVKDGVHITLAYGSEYYTDELEQNGNKRVFTNANTLQFIIDNLSQENLYYWKLNAGWQRLDSRKTNDVLLGSTQDEVFQRLFDTISTDLTSKVNEVEHGMAIRDAAMGGGALGVKKDVTVYSKFTLNTQMDIGPQLSTLKYASYLSTNSKTSTSFLIGNRDLRFEVGVPTKYHEKGFEYSPYWQVSYGNKKWEMGMRGQHYLGDPMNYVLYNIPNDRTNHYDPTMMIYYRVRLNK